MTKLTTYGRWLLLVGTPAAMLVLTAAPRLRGG